MALNYIPALGQIAFALYALIILFGGGLAVIAHSLVRAMVGLVISLFGVAGMYLLLLADFVALMQILIYVGAVSVLIFFAIMLTRASADGGEGDGPGKRGLLRAIPAFLVPTALMVIMLSVYGVTRGRHAQKRIRERLGRRAARAIHAALRTRLRCAAGGHSRRGAANV